MFASYCCSYSEFDIQIVLHFCDLVPGENKLRKYLIKATDMNIKISHLFQKSICLIFTKNAMITQ